MQAIPITLEQRYEFVDNRNVTINGKPAIISGAKCAFACVRSLDGSTHAEYTWHAVRLIIETRNGKFKT